MGAAERGARSRRPTPRFRLGVKTAKERGQHPAQWFVLMMATGDLASPPARRASRSRSAHRDLLRRLLLEWFAEEASGIYGAPPGTPGDKRIVS